MLDLSHIPNSQQDIQVFYANGGAWQTWRKPRKCKYVWIMCIGGGAGGANGGTSNNTVGSPGGPGAVTKALFNAFLLSDILYVQTGLGGAGGIVGSPGGNGSKSYVSLQPSLIVQNLILTSGSVVAGSGSAETAASQGNMIFSSLGNFTSTAGPANSNSDINPLTSTIVTQGGAGAFKDSTVPSVTQPRSIFASSLSPLISAGVSSTTIDGTNGSNGYTSWKPFFSTGGAGGGSSTVGVGGNGGNGGIGSGGGSGGPGQIVGGDGGKGGDGLVVIISF